MHLHMYLFITEFISFQVLCELKGTNRTANSIILHTVPVVEI